MSDYVVQLDPEVKRADATCEIRVRASGGKYVTLTVKDGETLTTKDAVTSAAIASLGARVTSVLATPPSKPTYDVDMKPKETLAAAPEIAK